jgi:hypothetical protein
VILTTMAGLFYEAIGETALRGLLIILGIRLLVDFFSKITCFLIKFNGHKKVFYKFLQ